MKKAISFMLAVMCLACFAGCSQQQTKDEISVYSFSGSSDKLEVYDGVIVLDTEEEVFSGGKLKILDEEIFSDAVFFSEKFYVTKQGEKLTVQHNMIEDKTGGAEVVPGDDLGKISGPDVMGEYEEFADNLYFCLEVTDSDGETVSYEVKMDVERVN